MDYFAKKSGWGKGFRFFKEENHCFFIEKFQVCAILVV